MKFNWKFWKRKKKITFPCTEICIVKPMCSSLCDKLLYSVKDVTAFFSKHKCCPDCGNTKFYEGPSGGMSMNVQCSGCGHWFNTTPYYIERISQK